MARKVCAALVNCWLNRCVLLHNFLHRFRRGRGTGIATLEAKLAQKLAGLAHDPLFQVFLDIYKAHDSLDRERCLEVLNGYGLGTNLTCLLKYNWERKRIAPKTDKLLRKVFQMGRGLTQGYPALSMIFNTVVDAVVPAVFNVVCGPQEAHHGLGWAVGEGNVIFYADDGRIAGQDQEWVQDALSVSVKMFQKMGLEANLEKYKTMV